MSIYAVSLTEFNDRSLMRAIHDVPPNSMILFEDIDCMRAGNARPNSESQSKLQNPARSNDSGNQSGKIAVTLSGLLNVLDGFHAPEAVLFIMTTNKIETLDDALLRPGRIDYRLYLGKAAQAQKLELYRRFFPLASAAEAEAFVELNRLAENMAEFQGLLLAVQQDRTALEPISN
jgi:chaperone BCS1